MLEGKARTSFTLVPLERGDRGPAPGTCDRTPTQRRQIIVCLIPDREVFLLAVH
jgi:hypothetical protein